MPASSISCLKLCRWILGLLLAGQILAQAQTATVKAYVEPGRARPNQMVNYVITVQNGSVNSIPNLRFPLQIGQNTAASTSQQLQIMNGVRTLSIRLSWGISASEPGEFVIAPQEVVVDGQVMRTNEVKLVVAAGDAAGAAPDPAAEEGPAPLLQLELGKTEFYQGETITLTASLFVPSRMPLRRMGLVDMNKTDFAIARFPQQSEQTMTDIDGVGYYVLTFRSTLSALRTGDLKVGPASMDILVEVPAEGGGARRAFPPGFPQAFFGTPTEPRKVTVKSQTIPVKVLPLPQEGKPASFSGAVGDFAITGTATPTELTVGDPLSAELTIEGSGNFDGLANPVLANPAGWKLYPPKRYTVEGQMDQNQMPTLDRKIGFSQVLVPERVHAELPPFEVSFFSPTQRKYVTLRTAAVKLNMKPAAATAEASGAATTSAETKPAPPPVLDPQATLSDIVVQPAPSAHWLAPMATTWALQPKFWSLQAVPVALLVAACLFAGIQRRREGLSKGQAGIIRLAWQQVEESGLSDQEFLRRAAQFIQVTEVPGQPRSPAAQALWERYQTMNFTGSSGAPLSLQERQDMLATLRALKQSALHAAANGPSKTALASTVGLLLLFLACSPLAQAQDKTAVTSPPVSAKAEAPSVKPQAAPDEVYREAKAELEKGNFTRAQYLAESLTKRKPAQLSAELFELIGHARYRQGDMGRAVLWYERALLFQPRAPELRQNLRHLYEKLRFVSFGATNPLIQASQYLTTNEWTFIAAAAGWLVFLALSGRVLIGRASRANATLRIWAMVICVLSLLVALPAAAMASLRPSGAERVRDLSIITAPDVHVYTSATVTAGTVIDLPPGSQVRLLDQRGAWTYVEIPNQSENLRGWVETLTLTPLWSWEPAMVP